MKLISLNTWGARAGIEKVLAFLETHQDADIFCLQEMWNGGGELAGKMVKEVDCHAINEELFNRVQKLLTYHASYFRPHYFDFYGLAIFIKREIKILEEGEYFVFKEKGYRSPEQLGNHARNIQYVTIDTPAGLRTVINLHGLWNGQGKGDTADRLLQSDNILTFATTLNHPFVLVGDFNLLPDTESIKKFEDYGLRNLIKEYGITSTRTSLYKKDVRFADYAFLSNDIVVKDFKVLPDEVSDHSPLIFRIYLAV